MKSSASNATGPGDAGLFRLTLAALLTLAVLFPPVAGAIERSDRIARVHGDYYEAEDFYRISEYFTGRENFGGRLVRRSQDDRREGYYITVRLRSYPYQREVENAVRLDIIRPGLLEPETYWFSLGPGKRRSPEVLVGVTGSDWPDPEAQPLAWRLAFYDRDGNELAWAKSYLWGENVPADDDS